MSQNNKQRLELTWIGKGQEPKLEPRILIEDQEKSYGDPHAENMLIHGDNLLALKALEQQFAGKVKCICIDPPYNTGSAFEHYDDGLEHSQWLNLMSPRLKLLRNLLSDDGSIWISIDDNECHYLKVLCDEVFGRSNFVANVIWQKRTSPDNRLRLGAAHDHILVYGKMPLIHKKFNQLDVSESREKDFKNPDNDPNGPWASVDFTGMAGHATASQFYTIISPAGKKYAPPPGRCWAIAEENFKELVTAGRVWFGKNGNSRPRLKRYLFEIEGQNAWTWWDNKAVGHNQEAKKEIIALFGNKAFDTPKPERLIERIIHIATGTGDLVLDSFLGSATTAAVAHKMNRRWIGIELGDHAYTHCQPRLKKVVDGLDEGGITKAVNWQGGGGFKFYELAPSLLRKDSFGNWVIDPSYNADMLAAAMAKHEGYDYRPHEQLFWKQGQSTEQDFIFTTTQFVTVELLDKIYEQMQEGESLLICCKAFQEACEHKYPAINIRKIPVMLLGRCEFGKNDYSLNIINMPREEEEEPFIPAVQKMPPQPSPEEDKAGGQQGKLF
jgi:adenine-specific DNA-methyltransferase